MTWRLIGPIWRLPDVTASQRLVLLALASFTDKAGANAYPSQATLSRMACCSARTVRRALADLIAMELITPSGKGRRGTIRYAVNVNVLGRADTSGHSPRSPTSTNPINYNNKPGNSNPGERDSFIYARNQQAIQVDKFSSISPVQYSKRGTPLPESGGEMSIRVQREREARRKG
jgi:hypothetical protein